MKPSERVIGLNPDIAASALVGSYMLGFAAMESAINSCIEEAFGLSGADIFVLSSNLNFRGKINILKTINNERQASDNAKRRVSSILERAAKHSTSRNVIAHSLFGPEQEKSGRQTVSFLRTSATGKLKLEPISWPYDKFDQCDAQFNELHHKLYDFSEELRKSSAELSARIDLSIYETSFD